MNGNISSDPLFCDTGSGDFRLASDSPCLGGSCGQIGAFGIGCLGEAPRILSVLDVDGDQGRQVRLRWLRSSYDAAGDTIDITGYGVYRRQDEYLSPKSAPTAVTGSSFNRLRLDGWDYVATVPARGDSIYQTVAPTLCDSTVDGGVCWSVFFLSAMTPDPLVFFDSPPDSGYSIDNVPPDAPGNLVWEYPAALAWDESEDPNFSYFTIYGSDNLEFHRDWTLLAYTTETSFSLENANDIYQYYLVTATDAAGNEGDHALLLTPSDIGTDEGTPVTFSLRQGRPNPFTSNTTIAFDLPEPCVMRLAVYDTEGRLVRTLADGMWSIGTHAVEWDGRNDDGHRVASGIYFFQLYAGDHTARREIVLLE
jgi:hypothetical protein